MLEVDAADVRLGDVPPGEFLHFDRELLQPLVIEGEVLIFLLAVVGRREAEPSDGSD